MLEKSSTRSLSKVSATMVGMETCSFSECDRALFNQKHRLCKPHAQQLYRAGRLTPLRATPQKLYVSIERWERECGICHKVKSLDAFPLNSTGGKMTSGGPGGRQSYCYDCYRDYQRDHATPEHRRHGLTDEQFAEFWAAQGGRCAICSRGLNDRLKANIDHDHAHCPGRYGCAICVRGLLCPPCNTRLGTIEDMEWKKLAYAYLNARADSYQGQVLGG